MILNVKRSSAMFKKKTLPSVLLLTTVVASFATTAFAGEPSQIPGYDRHGSTVPIPNPDRS
jgi:hypothetical protein